MWAWQAVFLFFQHVLVEVGVALLLQEREALEEHSLASAFAEMQARDDEVVVWKVRYE